MGSLAVMQEPPRLAMVVWGIQDTCETRDCSICLQYLPLYDCAISSFYTISVYAVSLCMQYLYNPAVFPVFFPVYAISCSIMQCVVLTAVFVCVLHLSVYTLQYESVYVAAVSIVCSV